MDLDIIGHGLHTVDAVGSLLGDPFFDEGVDPHGSRSVSVDCRFWARTDTQSVYESQPLAVAVP